MDDIVKSGSYVIVQRQNYMKYHKIGPKTMECRLGKDSVDLKNILDEPFFTTYKMESKKSPRNYFDLVKIQQAATISADFMKTMQSGTDNRDISDDGSSQKLSTEEIVGLRDSGLSAKNIVGALIENSTTFSSKTEYSQEKYLKKKEKKYFEYVSIRKPTLRLVSEIMLGKGIGKTIGLRMDTLAQLTSIACVRSGGHYVAYETGCQGLVCAAMLNALGEEGTIFHVHCGNTPDRQALQVLNHSQDRLNQVQSVNIHRLVDNQNKSTELIVEECDTNGKRKTVDDTCSNKRGKWEETEAKAIGLLKERLTDGLIVVGKEHPSNITTTLLKYLKPSRPFVIFFNVREPLQEMFVQLKMRSDVTALRLTETWLRSFQVLPDRTHPDVNMSGSGGFLLSGIKVSS